MRIARLKSRIREFFGDLKFNKNHIDDTFSIFFWPVARFLLYQPCDLWWLLIKKRCCEQSIFIIGREKYYRNSFSVHNMIRVTFHRFNVYLRMHWPPRIKNWFLFCVEFCIQHFVGQIMNSNTTIRYSDSPSTHSSVVRVHVNRNWMAIWCVLLSLQMKYATHSWDLTLIANLHIFLRYFGRPL